MHYLLSLPYTEILGWVDYFNRRPVGWREDDRTYKLLQAQGTKASPSALFSSLAVITSNRKPMVSDDGFVDTQSFKTSHMFQMLQSAQGGDQIDFDKIQK